MWRTTEVTAPGGKHLVSQCLVHQARLGQVIQIATAYLQSCNTHETNLRNVFAGILELASGTAQDTKLVVTKIVQQILDAALNHNANRKLCKVALNLLFQLSPRHEAFTDERSNGAAFKKLGWKLPADMY